MDHSTDLSAAQAITVPHDADLRPSKPPGRPGRSRGIRRVVLWIVGLVGMAIVGAILVLRWTDGDVIEPSTKADLDGEATIDPVDAAAVREPFMELQRFRATDCP